VCAETRWTRLDEHLVVHHGAINVGIIVDGREALLIDSGDGSVRDTLQALGVDRVVAILFTHHHRDQCSGAPFLLDDDTWVGAPAAEASLLTDPEQFWADPRHRWHLYDLRPQSLVVAEPVPVHKKLVAGDTVRWGPAVIRVLHTPGHTDGSLSYVVGLPDDGGKRYVFCGDLLCGEGQLWDLYSLQKGWLTRDYHGFLGDRERLIQSLRQVQDLHSGILVSSHGEIVDEPSQAIDLACSRLDECYRQYVATSALHHYFPDLFASMRGHVSTMPPSPHLDVPQYLHHIGTTWLIESGDGPVFVVDCGSHQVIETVHSMQSRGELGAVEQLWISHYHDDHVDGIPDCVEAFGCQVLADVHVAQVVEQPEAWRLPCISPVQIWLDRQTFHGESWQWHEFLMTAYHLPGQTLYHGGLLVVGRGNRVLFVGDSFTPTGMDDYCMGNRNLLGASIGFDACLDLVQELGPDLLLNCHVDVGFCFTLQQIDWMRDNLAQRLDTYGQLVAWDHPNYGIDEHWVRCHPYQQGVHPGTTFSLSVVITNHSMREHTVRCRPCLPTEWHAQATAQSLDILPQREQCLTFEIHVPLDVCPRRYVLPVEMSYDSRRLGQFREMIVDVVGLAGNG